jgi:hypothetical protein
VVIAECALLDAKMIKKRSLLGGERLPPVRRDSGALFGLEWQPVRAESWETLIAIGKMQRGDKKGSACIYWILVNV